MIVCFVSFYKYRKGGSDIAIYGRLRPGRVGGDGIGSRKRTHAVGRTGAVLYTAGGCLQNILDKIFRKKDAKIFGSSEIVAIFAIPFGKQANT